MTTTPPVAPTPPRPPSAVARGFAWLWQQNLAGSLAIVMFTTLVIAGQVSTRTDFANTEVADAVESRWGAPVQQAAPSVRWVQSGTVFTELSPLALAQQHVKVDAQMNYRKRGLAYFSGFDFVFDGSYVAKNEQPHDIDVAFVFPIEVDKSQVLLSELSFAVNDQPAPLDLGDQGNRLVWTGRLPVGGEATFHIRYKARGLESFVYSLDPSLPAHDVTLNIDVEGGDNIDYPAYVLAASEKTIGNGRASLVWKYPSLESGVALGVVLPSMKKYDDLVATMSSRAFFPALAFFAVMSLLSLKHRRRLSIFESYVAAAAFGFTFVLLAYLGAFMHFVLAWALTMSAFGAAVVLFISRLFPDEKKRMVAGAWVATQVIPTAAVLLPGFTGLIYTLELLAALLAAMALITNVQVRAFLSDRLSPGAAS